MRRPDVQGGWMHGGIKGGAGGRAAEVGGHRRMEVNRVHVTWPTSCAGVRPQRLHFP